MSQWPQVLVMANIYSRQLVGHPLLQYRIWSIHTCGITYFKVLEVGSWLLIVGYALWWLGYQLTITVQNGGPQPISEILHIEYQIVRCIEIYSIHIYHMSKCSKCNWNRYIKGICMWNVHFHINVLSQISPMLF